METGVKIWVRGQELPLWMVEALRDGRLRLDKSGAVQGTRRSPSPLLRALNAWKAQTAQKENVK
jgi:hypothetical protein